MKFYPCIILILILLVSTSFAQSNGKISGYMFGDYYYVVKNHDSDLQDKNAFQFRRIYVTYDKDIADNFSTRFRVEMANAGDLSTKSKMSPVVKDAYLKWKLSSVQLILGISSTPTWGVAEKTWGYRSVEKNPLDLQKWGSSRDFGLGLKGKLGKIKYHAMLGNGNSNSSESNKGKKGMLSLGLPVSDKIHVEVYGDWNSVDGENDIYTVQGFAAYKTDNSRIGVQVAQQIHQIPGADSETMNLVSAFAVIKLRDKCNAFARIDKMLDPNPNGHKIAYIPFDNTAKSTFIVAGLDHSPAKNVHLMPNIEAVRYEENDAGNKPDLDLIPRLTVYYKF